MRKMKWTDIQSCRRVHLLDMMRREALKRLPRTRPRDPDEERALSQIVQTRWERWLASGKLVILEPRRWRLRLGSKSEEISR